MQKYNNYYNQDVFILEIPSLLTLFHFQFPIQVKVTKTLEFILKAVFSSQQ